MRNESFLPYIAGEEIMTSLEYQERLRSIGVGTYLPIPRRLRHAAHALPDGRTLRRQRTISRKRKRVEEHGSGDPALLSLDLASCDGGQFDSEFEYGPLNVLLNDTSVYCSARHEANMLFKHVGGVPFCVSRVVIKAPASGFTCPIEKGSVAIFMDQPDLDALSALGHVSSDDEDQDMTEEIRGNPDGTVFSIHPDRYRCDISFSPEISGRYILLRLASSSISSNIDIQTIMAYGYVGRRFFPAIKTL